MEKISVIVPIFNAQKYLTQCLDSLVYQTYCELEIILIDDFSIDDSKKIALEYEKKDKRIKLFQNKINKGLARAKNFGLENSKGEYIFFLDGCDYLDVDAIKNAYLEIKGSNSDMVITKTIPFEDGDIEKQLDMKTKARLEWSEFQTREYFEVKIDNFEYAIANFPTSGFGKLYKSDFLKKNKIFFIDKNTACENEGFFLKIMSKFPKISSIDAPGVYYRMKKSFIKELKNPKIPIQDALCYIKNNSSKSDFKVFFDAIFRMYDYLCFSLNPEENGFLENVLQK